MRVAILLSGLIISNVLGWTPELTESIIAGVVVFVFGVADTLEFFVNITR
jgi:hypothetical protein